MCNVNTEAPPGENKFEKSPSRSSKNCFYLEIKDVMHISLTGELISVSCKFWDFCRGVALQYQV